MLVLDSMTRYPNAHFYGLNPGIIKTNIRDNLLGKGSFISRFVESFISLITITPEYYAERLVPILVGAELDTQNGSMFDPKGKVIKVSKGLTEEHISTYMSAANALIAKANK